MDTKSHNSRYRSSKSPAVGVMHQLRCGKIVAVIAGHGDQVVIRSLRSPWSSCSRWPVVSHRTTTGPLPDHHQTTTRPPPDQHDPLSQPGTLVHERLTMSETSAAP